MHQAHPDHAVHGIEPQGPAEPAGRVHGSGGPLRTGAPGIQLNMGDQPVAAHPLGQHQRHLATAGVFQENGVRDQGRELASDQLAVEGKAHGYRRPML